MNKLRYTLTVACVLIWIYASSSSPCELTSANTIWAEQATGLEAVKLYLASDGFLMVQGREGVPIKYDGSDTQAANDTRFNLTRIQDAYPANVRINIGGTMYNADVFKHRCTFEGQPAVFDVYDLSDGNGSFYEICMVSKTATQYQKLESLSSHLRLLPLARMSLDDAIRAVHELNNVLMAGGGLITDEISVVSAEVDRSSRTYRRIYGMNVPLTPETERSYSEYFSRQLELDSENNEICRTFHNNGYRLELVMRDVNGREISVRY